MRLTGGAETARYNYISSDATWRTQRILSLLADRFAQSSSPQVTTTAALLDQIRAALTAEAERALDHAVDGVRIIEVDYPRSYRAQVGIV